MGLPKVILITPGFTADTFDHNCQPTLQLFVLELLRQGMEVQIIALDYPFSSRPYQWHGAEVFPCGGNNSRWLKPRTLWRARQMTARLLSNGEAAVLHSFWLGWASAVGERVARQKKARHITTLMGQDVLPQNRHRFRFLTPERQQRLVALSHFQNDALAQHAGFRADHVIPWGVSEAEIPAALSGERSIDILGAGSLIPLKNWDLWLQTVAILAKDNPKIRAELMGNGPERARLERVARALGLAGCVHFTGESSRPQVLQKMQQARVLLHTSRYESQGYVLSEAAMNGCRIVGTPVGIGPLMGACGENAPDLAVLARRALADAAAIQPVTPFLMADTVRDYRKLYGGIDFIVNAKWL